MSDAKQVATKKENLPSASLFEADAQAGFENVKTEKSGSTYLKILQNGSAEAQKRNQNYVEGAEPGMFLNTVTKQLYDGDKGIQVIPCHYKLEYQEWADYGTGSGRPEMIFPDTSDILDKNKGNEMVKIFTNGNYILTVGQHFVIIIGDKENETAMISMSSSQGKISRKWNSMMKSISLDGKNGPYTPPSFSHIYKLSSVLNTGKGNQWYGYNVEKVGMLEDAKMYERAKKFYEGIKNKA